MPFNKRSFVQSLTTSLVIHALLLRLGGPYSSGSTHTTGHLERRWFRTRFKKTKAVARCNTPNQGKTGPKAGVLVPGE
jgi:hypothetical protein